MKALAIRAFDARIAKRFPRGFRLQAVFNRRNGKNIGISAAITSHAPAAIGPDGQKLCAISTITNEKKTTPSHTVHVTILPIG